MNRAKRDVVPQGHLFRCVPLQDAVPYGRRTPYPTRFYPVISTRVPSLSSTQLS